MIVIIGGRAYTIHLYRYTSGYGASTWIRGDDDNAEMLPIWSDDQDYEFPAQAIGSVIANLYAQVVPAPEEEVDQCADENIGVIYP